MKSAPIQLIPSKSVGKSIVPSLEKPQLTTLLAADPLIHECDTLLTMQLLSVSVPLLKLPWVIHRTLNKTPLKTSPEIRGRKVGVSRGSANSRLPTHTAAATSHD